MIYLNQGQNNQVAAICTRNETLSGTVYFLWSLTHLLSNKKYRFIPYMVTSQVPNPYYDLFCIEVNDSIPQVLTGATSCGQTNVHLIPGEYSLAVFEQYSPSNLNPQLSNDLIYNNLVTVVGTNQYDPAIYQSGQTDTYIIYDPDNDNQY